MQQQVNLLNCLPEKKQLLSAKHMFLCFFCVLSILITMSLWQWSYVAAKHKDFKFATNEFQLVEERLHELQMDNPIIAKHKSLKHQLGVLHKQLMSEKIKFEQLSQRVLESGFSMYLKLLAQKVAPAVQLDAIFISHVNENITLYGQSKSARDVSAMVKKLYLSPLLKGVVFSQYVLARKSELIKFEVATKELVSQSKILKNAFLQGKLQRKLLLENKK